MEFKHIGKEKLNIYFLTGFEHLKNTLNIFIFSI